MSSSVKMVSHEKDVLSKHNRAKKAGLITMAEAQNGFWKDEIQRKNVIDSGRYFGSPTYNLPNDDSIVVGTPVGSSGAKDDGPYPIYLELGTDKMTSRPTLGPSIQNNRGGLKDGFEKGYKPVMK